MRRIDALKAEVETPRHGWTGRWPKYTSMGCYPLFYITRDMSVLCADCMNGDDAKVGHEDAQWDVVDFDTNWEDATLYCDHCSERIESAYAEPEEEKES